MSAVPAARGLRRLGRFELVRELGRGAQATVWLAHDTRLEREVALKLLDPAADAAELSEWLHEARAVSRLAHPHIVPVFEADVADGQPYLVFEFVDGPTLGAERRARPKWSAREAVQLLLGVLDALAAAHAQGIVHRDLKPSNILIGRDGRARVMDFGIAARVASAQTPGDGRIVGTPGYMSPEAARGEAPQPAMDVFAAGMMLGELLAGAPLMRERDPWRYVERVQREDLGLPAEAGVDETLRGIVQRALARAPEARYDGARALHAALAAWLAPAEAPLPQASHGTLEFLLRRMRHKSDFPGLSDAVLRIQRVAASESANLGALTDEILRDVALTNKLLRMVNSVHFSSVAGGGIHTVSRAISLVGFAGIRNMALAVLLLEHMQDKAHAARLREEFTRALMAGSLASELVPWQRDSEEAFLGSMFQNLGRLLTEFYFPEEAQQIRKQLPDAQAPHAQREAAALRVLGIGLDELGAGVARAWGLPENLQLAMRAPPGDAPARPLPRGVERARWLGRAANGLTDALLQGRNEGEGSQALLAAAAEYAGVLELSVPQIVGATDAARARLAQLAGAMGLTLPRGARSQRLLASQPAPAESAPGPASAAQAGRAPPSTPATPATPAGGAAAAAAAPPAGGSQQPAARAVPAPAALGASAPAEAAADADAAPAPAEAALQAALDEVALALDARSMRLNELLSLAFERMHGALALRAVVLCLRDAEGVLQGRFALGPVAASRLAVAPKASGDLFAVLCAKGADLHVADAGALGAKLPPWYRSGIGAGSFLALPLMVKGRPLGLIYADKEAPNSLRLAPRELALLRALRDKVVVALTRGG